MPQVRAEHKPLIPLKWKVVLGVILLAVVVGAYPVTMFFSAAPPQKAAARAYELSIQNRYAEASSLLKQSQTWRAWSKDDKVTVLAALAATAASANDLKTALGYFKQQEQLKPGEFLTYFSAAGVAERAGLKSEAIAQYNLALNALEKLPTSDFQQESPEFIKSKIAELQQ